MASNLVAMVSNLIARASNLLAASHCLPNSDGLQPNGDGLQPNIFYNCFMPKSLTKVTWATCHFAPETALELYAVASGLAVCVIPLSVWQSGCKRFDIRFIYTSIVKKSTNI